MLRRLHEGADAAKQALIEATAQGAQHIYIEVTHATLSTCIVNAHHILTAAKTAGATPVL